MLIYKQIIIFLLSWACFIMAIILKPYHPTITTCLLCTWCFINSFFVSYEPFKK